MAKIKNLFKRFWRFHLSSYKINHGNFRFLFLFGIVVFLISTFITIFTTIPTFFSVLSSNPSIYASQTYPDVYQLNDYPGNQLTINNLNSLTSDQLNNYGINLGESSNGGLNRYENANDENAFIRGFSTYDPTASGSQADSILHSLPGYDNSFLNNNSEETVAQLGQDWTKLVNYENGFTSSVPDFSNFSAIDQFFQSLAFNSVVGNGLGDSHGLLLSSDFFRSSALYNSFNKALNSSLILNQLGNNVGLRSRQVDGKTVWYGGENGDRVINNFTDMFASGTYQQLPFYLRNEFNRDNFALSFGSAPFKQAANSSNSNVGDNDEKFTYLNGSVNLQGKERNIETWGLNEGTHVKLRTSSNRLLNNEILNSNNSDSIIQNLQDLSRSNESDENNNRYNSVAIPVAINSTLARKYNLHAGQSLSGNDLYHINVPYLFYNDKNLTSTGTLEPINPNNYWFKSVINANTDSEFSGNVYYWNNWEQTRGGQTEETSNPYLNSASYLYQESRDDSNFTNPDSTNFMYYSSDAAGVNNDSSTSDAHLNSNFNNFDFADSNYHFVIKGVYNNYFTKPLFYMDQKIANYLNGYVNYGLDLSPNAPEADETNQNYDDLNYKLLDPTDTDFNGLLTTPEVGTDFFSSFVSEFSETGDYTNTGLNGTSITYQNGRFGRYAGTAQVQVGGPEANGPGNFIVSENEVDNTPNIIFNANVGLGLVYASNPTIVSNSINNLFNLVNQILSASFGVALLTAFFFLLIVFISLINRYRRLIGVYKAMGYSSLQIFTKFFSLYFYVSIGAFLIAIGAGYFASALVISGISKILFQLPFITPIIDFNIFATSLVLVFIFIALLAIFGLLYLAKLKPLKALRK